MFPKFTKEGFKRIAVYSDHRGVEVQNELIRRMWDDTRSSFISFLENEQDLYTQDDLDEGLVDALSDYSKDYVSLLLEYGADPNAQDGKPLWLAVRKGNPEAFEQLLNAGASPENIMDETGQITEYVNKPGYKGVLEDILNDFLNQDDFKDALPSDEREWFASRKQE